MESITEVSGTKEAGMTKRRAWELAPGFHASVYGLATHCVSITSAQSGSLCHACPVQQSESRKRSAVSFIVVLEWLRRMIFSLSYY